MIKLTVNKYATSIVYCKAELFFSPGLPSPYILPSHPTCLASWYPFRSNVTPTTLNFRITRMAVGI
jgi:hypothetical protein